MKIPYQLRCLPTSEPATSLLVPGRSAEDVLRVCVELRLDPLPAIFEVADGFVLQLPRPTELPIVGAIRLRRLSLNLLLPANAELIPPLLADEASALVRKRGLVFLPDGRVLEYDATRPMALAALLAIEPAARRDWRRMPEPRTLADDLTEITLLDIGGDAEQILAPGGEGIGTDSSELSEGNLPSRAAGNVLFNLGEGIANLGKAFNSKLLAGLGAKLLAGAMSLAPALSKKLMGEQEAKLRDLLRQFREGNIDQALKRALPLGGEPGRGMVPGQNAELPTHPLHYSLVNLLAGGSGGPISMWFTPDNTYYELLKEYRRQAELATQRGDFRRAAFIYAKLLNEYPSAARALAQGGLHRDAAVLYEKKLRDLPAAAREWRAAGEYDRAIEIHRKLGDHAAAGDLLRQIGEEDRAVREYQIAAAKLLETGPRHYEAGELMRLRAERADLALAYYEDGWKHRPLGNPLACATRIVQDHAAAGRSEPFLTLVDEADTFLVDHDTESTAKFFTEIARLAAAAPLQAIADEARDRALMGIARKLKQTLAMSPRQPAGLANLLKDPSVWPVPLVGDARHALTQAGRRPTAAVRPTYPTVRLGMGTVTAVCQKQAGSQVIVGFDTGEVACFDPESGAVYTRPRESHGILSLMTLPYGSDLVILSGMSDHQVRLSVVAIGAGFRMLDYCTPTVSAPALLAIPARNWSFNHAVLCHGSEYRLFSLPNLVAVRSGEFSGFDDGGEIPAAVAFSERSSGSSSFRLLEFHHDRVVLVREGSGKKDVQTFTSGWMPAIAAQSSLLQPSLDCVHDTDQKSILVVGIDTLGNLNHSVFDEVSIRVLTHRHRSPTDEGYLAFAGIHADLIVGVHGQGIDWWKPGGARPKQTKATLANPVAAFPLSHSNELAIVSADGMLTRIPIPG